MSMRHLIDEEKGIKWFLFYTKVRPWVVVLAFLAITIPDFIFNKYSNIEHPMLLVFQHPMFLVSLGLSIAQVVVSVKTFNKANGDYLEFTNFIPKVLVFEACAMTIQSFIEQYYAEGFCIAVITAVIAGLIGYFLWYKKMNEYFVARVKEDTID